MSAHVIVWTRDGLDALGSRHGQQSLAASCRDSGCAAAYAPQARVLEIGCGPGAAARAVAAHLTSGHILAIDRSAEAVAQARANSADEIAAGRMSVRQVAAEDFVLEPGEAPFDIAFAVRVGALDGRHPEAGQLALERIADALVSDGRLFIDGGRPLRELPIPPRT